jgi:putative transposase
MTFIEAHMDSIVATDLFTKTIWTWKGRFEAYCLFFIHLGTRRVYCSPVTFNPHEEWMMQQARNAAMWMEDEGIDMRFLIHDRDTKYSKRFRRFFRDIVRPRKGAVIRTHIESPRMNAFAEAFVATLRRECLGNFVCVSLDQLDHIINSYLRHYLTERPHQGRDIGNEVIAPDFTPSAHGEIRCRSSLGGMLRHYYRKAA